MNRMFQCGYTFILVFSVSSLWRSNAQCHNNCNRHGDCDRWGRCRCYTGYEGNDCGARTCPTGPQISEIPYDTDISHSQVACSGRGLCNAATGICQCDDGYFGLNCASTKCANDCSQHGVCLSLQQAAVEYDGYHLNHTTNYNLWDANTFFGCKCDPGWGGYDCSQKLCDSGADPRMSSLSHETVTLVCECTTTCTGKMKLHMMGNIASTWILPSTTADNLALTLMKIPGIFGPVDATAALPITAMSSANGGALSGSNTVCANTKTTTTSIYFSRQAGQLSALSFYQKRFTAGDIYFKTTETITCDCTSGCSGSFRVSFDGEISSVLLPTSTDTALIAALSAMKTVASAQIAFAAGSGSPICVSGSITSRNLVMTGSAGNLPMIQLWSSVVGDSNPSTYSSSSTPVLSIATSDGRDDHVKVCNGIGSCDYETGICSCPFGWEADPIAGPCGRPQMNTSDFQGIGRCPGIVSYDSSKTDRQATQNYQDRIYVSVNFNTPVGKKSQILRYTWMSEDLPTVIESTRTCLLNMTSTLSAGPLIVDQSKAQLIFVDNKSVGPFIGKASIITSPSDYTVWLQLSSQVDGFAMDTYFGRRKVYWTVAGAGAADGGIYWASVDSASPTINSLVSAIGQANLLNPKGIAVHYKQKKLYFLDQDASNKLQLKYCDLDGSNYGVFGTYTSVRAYTFSQGSYSSIGTYTLSGDYGDLKIDFFHNNTAFFIDPNDAASNPAIIKLNLDEHDMTDTNAMANPLFIDYYDHVLYDNTQIDITVPKYLAIDEWRNLFVYAGSNKINFARYIPFAEDFYPHGSAYSTGGTFTPIGIAIDRGLGSPTETFGNYLDCHGNGVCLGAAGNWACQCFPGYVGDCSARTCPKGPAWFSEPIVENIAHDVSVECSNMGICDRKSGTCKCNEGFSGAACDRMDCPGRNSQYWDCNGKGRCMSMRNAAAYYYTDSSLSSKAIVYGSSPHSASTWDANMIQVCVPYEYGYIPSKTLPLTAARQSSTINVQHVHKFPSYTGSNLYYMQCPYAYDMRIYSSDPSKYADGYPHEVQTLQCSATSGSFTLSFRGATTAAILSTAKPGELQEALQAMSTIGLVSVQVLGSSSTVCASTAVSTRITFITEVGLVPTMTAASVSLAGGSATVSVTETVRSSKTPFECAGKGSCDRSTGKCLCWEQYGSSDGLGGPGLLRDCGHNVVS